ncbi:MAG: AI-2E family transporter [Eubacterium sp.]|nr:AI-2E family transporter [Eubacterium sp.]
MKLSQDKKRILIFNLTVIFLAALLLFFLWPTLAEVSMPFVVAVILAYLLNPLVGFFERLGLGRGLSVLCVFILVAAMIAVLFMSFVPSLIRNISQMVTSIPQMLRELGKYSDSLREMIDWYNTSDAAKFFNLEESVASIATMIGKNLQDLSNAIIANTGQLMNVVITPLVTIFLLLDKEIFLRSLSYLVPMGARSAVGKMCCDIDLVIGGFIRGQGIMSVIAGVLTGLGAYLLKLPYAPVVGVIAGVTTMVPYFGLVVGMVIICLMSLIVSPVMMVYMLIWMCVVQVVCGNVLAPALMAGNVGLHPVVIIFSIFFFGALLGGWGMLLAVPIMGTINVVMKYIIAGFASSREENRG